MMFFGNHRERGHHIIVGCGRLGANLANTLSDEGKNVVMIDKNEGAFRKLSASFGGILLAGDATDLATLREAQIEAATAVITVTNHDNTNILVAQIAKEMFKIDQVVARLYDPERECVYHEFKIATISPATLSRKEIERYLGEGADR